ncbi:hypothetical protein VTK73DRAFT_2374 [Phialemonium thermophilum]|uniref:BPL/LPL catalytic domain-containing protein n=1 Tax=Phialemonium thermophilum TaxID=223376 RepID=A0ABR3VS88_9PEZI
MRLRHIHLPSAPPSFPPYRLATAVQELLRRELLDAKDLQAAVTSHPARPPPPPPPTLLSFTPQPTFTLGRRQTAPLSAEELARLQAPLHLRFRGDGGATHTYHPSVLSSPRGGLTTYHGPGQIVLWPIVDLRPSPVPSSPRPRRHFTVRSWARLLETTTMRTLSHLFGLAPFTTQDPGVWVRHRASGDDPSRGDGDLRKIAAMGVHLRRHVSALGVAINLDTPPPAPPRQQSSEGQDERADPWARFVACGLEGKGVTSVAREIGADNVPAARPAVVAAAWAEELAKELWEGPPVEDEVGTTDLVLVDTVSHFDVRELVARAAADGEARSPDVADWLDSLER